MDDDIMEITTNQIPKRSLSNCLNNKIDVYLINL